MKKQAIFRYGAYLLSWHSTLDFCKAGTATTWSPLTSMLHSEKLEAAIVFHLLFWEHTSIGNAKVVARFPVMGVKYKRRRVACNNCSADDDDVADNGRRIMWVFVPLIRSMSQFQVDIYAARTPVTEMQPSPSQELCSPYTWLVRFYLFVLLVLSCRERYRGVNFKLEIVLGDSPLTTI